MTAKSTNNAPKRRTRKKTEPVAKKLLDTIDCPATLRSLDVDDLPKLAAEIREFMIHVVSQHGGHLAPSLGATDLTIALHYAYNTPDDKLVWDVGHQAYAHKILTGRKDSFDTIRQYHGLSGFPRISESEYDALSVGHASTSISAGLGMALARDLRGEKHSVVSIIGDGALTGGLAFEGLNNLGSSPTNMTVVLNDNEMSISKNVGAMSRYLTRVITDKRFNRIKNDVWELLGQMPGVGKRIRDLVHNVDDALKHFVIPGKLFEDMGLRYFGPVDGHNVRELAEVFKFVKNNTSEPILVHVVTKKGKGYSFAESDATKYHGVGKFAVETGSVNKTDSAVPSYSEVFGRTLEEIGRTHENVVAITAGMADGTGLSYFRDAFPKRFFDVGIAEQHAVTFAAGLALKGLKPVISLYSTFLQRAYDQIVHDIALDSLNAVICIDRAGLVGEDGPTHHGMLDIAFLRSIPNVTIMAPSDEKELRDMLYTAIVRDMGPTFIRYPRGKTPGVRHQAKPVEIPLCSPRRVVEGKNIAFVCLGPYLSIGEDACRLLEEKGHKPSLIDARFAKPLDKAFYAELFVNHETIVTLESGVIDGGFGSAILELGSQEKNPPRVIRIGYPDEFVVHGSLAQLHEQLGLTPLAIANRIAEAV